MKLHSNIEALIENRRSFFKHANKTTKNNVIVTEALNPAIIPVAGIINIKNDRI
jgi:hypothetical protein